MKTVGSILKEKRLAKGWSLERVEQATKIRIRFLEAIERDDYSVLPSLAYAKGFVKNYSDFLGLDSKTTLAFFRRQTTEVPKSSLLPKKNDVPDQSMFRLTPAKFIALIVSLLVFAFLGYFGLQFRRIQLAPSLTIDDPKPQEVVTERKTDILGKTDPDATVTVNGITVLVRSDGKFFDQVALEPGVNKITITATSRFGKTTTVVREVGLQLP